MKGLKFIKVLFAKLNEEKIDAYTAQCSYYVILSFVPFIILLITIIQYTGINQQVLYDIISKIIPSSMNEFIVGIVKEVYSKSIGTISISIIFTIWSARRGLLALIKGLHSVYDINDKKSNSPIYLEVKSIIETILFIFLTAAGLTLLVFGTSIVSICKENFEGLKNYNLISEIIIKMIFTIVTFFVFISIYIIMPKHKVTFKSQFPGAVFASLCLNIISFIFSRYLDIFKGFSVTYGSLTTIMLIMMWVYSCFYTLFIGAEINQNIKRLKKL